MSRSTKHRFTNILLCTIGFGLACSSASNAEEPNATKLSDRIKKIKAASTAVNGGAGVTNVPSNPLYNQILKSVALILCESPDGSTCNGTGWVLDAKERLLVTNHHVIEGFTDCKVFFAEFVDGKLVTDPSRSIVPSRAISGRVVDSDPEVDLAIVQLDKLPADVPELELAENSATPGQNIHSIAGSTIGSQSLWVYSTGHVRQIVRGVLATGYEANILESDMATNQGNSGGPVCDDQGRVVAVVEGARTDARLVSLKVELQSLAAYLADGLRCVAPTTAEDLKFAAERHLVANRPDVALKLITAALKKDRNAADLFALRGKCWVSKGDLDSARGDFEEALKLDNGCSEAHCGNGVIAFQDGEYEDSVEHYSNALRNDPGNQDYLILRAEARDYFGDYQLAYQDYQEVLKANPNSVRAIRGRAIVEVELGNFEAGLQGLNSIVQYFNDDPDVYYFSGYAMNQQSNFADAAVVLRHVLELDSEYELAFQQLGNALVGLGQYQEAVDVLKAAIEQDPEDAESYLLLGTAVSQLGDLKTGQALIKKSMELAGDDQELKATAKEILVRLRNQ